MKSSVTVKDISEDNFHKICVVGGGITGAMMVLLLKNSNLFKLNDIGWIKPQEKLKDDFRTTFFNKTSMELLNNLKILKKLKKSDYTPVSKIKVYGTNHYLPLEWDYSETEIKFGAVIKNKVILNILEDQLKDITQYDSFVNNTKCNNFERTLYLENKTYIKTHLVLSADGKILSKKITINKYFKQNIKHIAISGFLNYLKSTIQLLYRHLQI